jgi:isoleucyl-tRNA synthetase
MFEPVAARYVGPELEKGVLELWRRENVFGRIMAEGPSRPKFVFYEGPPTANGRPGIHHVLARTFKDLYPRYKTMRGFHCPRKAGWDTHGLPVEHEIEKELGIFDKRRIEQEVGIASFTAQCRASVMRHVAEWEAMTERMGFWVDFKDAYFTLHNSYIETVWSLLKQIWDKGLIYQGYKVVPYDPRIGATLSSHEVAQGYREVEDPSVYVRFRVQGEPSTFFLVWTTTPWTLPANLLLAVHPDVEYAWVKRGDETLILAKPLVGAVLKDDDVMIVRTALGRDLDGMRYERLFDYLPAAGDICRVRSADFVTTEDGTGIVHVAPAYGEDDLKLGQRHGLPVLHAVGEDGYFLSAVTPVAGKFFKDADPAIIEILRERGLLLRAQKYLHNYPFGWRTGDPLIYYAKNAWYIRTTEYRQRMVELNRGIKWVPEHIRDGRFGNWLENNIDWALSRERFWGTPLPLWTDGDGNYLCIGSVAELEQRAGRKLGDLDLHRPAIEQARRPRLAPSGDRLGHVRARGPRISASAGGHRLLVRLGRHAVRAVALPVRECRRLQQQLSGRLHLRGHRSDARLVLHAARDRDDGVGLRRLQERSLPESHRGRRRQEDVEVARQHHQPVRRVRRRRRRCLALAFHGARGA